MAVSEVNLPDIGEGVTEGELIRWLVKPGDTVKPDQAVAEIMTDKATVEVPSPVAGKVKELGAKEGDMIAIGKKLLSLETGGSAPQASQGGANASRMGLPHGAEAAPPQQKGAAGASPALSARNLTSVAAQVQPPVAGSHVLATPSTRRLARELDVDINVIEGTGLAGRVTRDDLLTQTQGGAPSSKQAPYTDGHSRGELTTVPGFDKSLREERVPLRGIRKKIAENMQMAKQIVPHFTLMEEADVRELVALRTRMKRSAEQQGVKITYLPFVMKALIATLGEFPMLNASIDEKSQEIVYKHFYHVGFAADTPNGLMVPVIKFADQKSFIEISREISDLAIKARDGKLKSEEMKDATITITNIGSLGGMYATPIINHPEVAILGMYRIVDRPRWENGAWVPVQIMNFTITADHRLIDGAVAARFLKSFLEKIENPANLMMNLR